MTVVVLAQQADTPVDAVVRELTAREIPVFRADTSWFPRDLVLEARLNAEGQWTGELRSEHRTVDLEAIRSIWHRDPGAFSFAEGMAEVSQALFMYYVLTCMNVTRTVTRRWAAWKCRWSGPPVDPIGGTQDTTSCLTRCSLFRGKDAPHSLTQRNRDHGGR